ncbi:RteC domain-containing protein [Elizabethkingia bruuniana]|uniref:RteC domain-containing protein n=3 Tax=Weeksellaceae TaxID=2762318 RepID=A0A7T7V0F4_9FLAO|nr:MULTISPECIES: RteC domain-containing protein [Bacteroidota]KGO11067.1 tetracycline regulation of excision, RteC [Elizabethkingia miricola]MDV3778139.1 tetracycline regulation of excision, RteC [Elizabethkingia anophelis]AQX83512.1 tetracycline regulation of excision, RteC [Elizabethkingia bruuniana]EFK36980.1 RteC protein [Chryseobacterium gleum ATCC 35910]KUY21731.1 tetracycline regulation of excision, RteC [Elizabethkingia bruuniana]
MISSLNHIISKIQRKENAISLSAPNAIDEAYQMTIYLKEYLWSIREDVTKQGFKNHWEEINFFRNIKPYILSKLIYHNKIFRIQTACPVDGGKMYASYFLEQLKELKQEYREHIYNSDFYRYYRSGRTDRDETYFRLGNINFHDGLNSFVFEIDPLFSTYYDNKVARIIANELLYTYILQKINDDEMADFSARDISDSILWTDTKNALIELIYALYANSSLSNGKIGIRKISLALERMFQISLGDLHHSFHRMKYRAGSRTAFLDQLKSSLEEYMDKDL